MKTDSDGNYQWHVHVGTNYFTRLHDIKIYNDTLYAVGKFIQDNSTGNLQEPLKQYILKCNTDGTIYWSHSIPQESFTARDWHAETCVVLENGNLLVGAGITEGNWQLPYNRPMLMELDNDNGEPIWQKGYGPFLGSNHFKQIRPLMDGNYLSTGEDNVYQTVEGGGKAPFVMKFSADGDSIWKRTIVPTWYASDGFPAASASLVDFVINDDGGITAIGELATYTGDGPQSGWIQDTYIVRLDSMGCLVPGCDTLVNVAEHSIQKLAVGLYPNPAANVLNIHFENAQLKQRSTFEIYNLSGQMIKTWQSNLQSATYRMDISELPNGNYLLRAVNESGQYVQEKFIVIK